MGQQRLGAVERLNLALFVHAQDQGAVRRVGVEADDVADLVDEMRFDFANFFNALGSRPCGFFDR